MATPKPQSYQQAVLATLAYFDIFDHPLTLDELNENLIGFEPDRTHVALYLRDSKKIHNEEGYITIAGREKIIQERKENRAHVIKLWKRVHRYAWVFSIVPYLRMVAVCNTLAFNNIKPGSDIDLFIIAKHNRLFTARAVLTALLHLLGVRRHGTKVADRFCLSFYVTDNHLSLASLAQTPYDIYLAYWVKTLAPITGRETYLSFLLKNQWISDYFPQKPKPNEERLEKTSFLLTVLQRFFEFILNTQLGQKLEDRLAAYQKKRAENKKRHLGPESDIIIKENILKFHNIDRRKKIRELWEERLEKIL